MDKKIDLTKPIRHKETKRPARVICADRKDDSFPIILLYTYGDGREAAQYLTWSTLESQYENVPEKKSATVYLVKGNYSGNFYVLEEEALMPSAYTVLDKKVVEFEIP